jgi:hypothetical protein
MKLLVYEAFSLPAALAPKTRVIISPSSGGIVTETRSLSAWHAFSFATCAFAQLLRCQYLYFGARKASRLLLRNVRPYGTSVCGLKLLVYEAFSSYCMRP